jgi:hypothetical protein
VRNEDRLIVAVEVGVIPHRFLHTDDVGVEATRMSDAPARAATVTTTTALSLRMPRSACFELAIR